MIFSYLRKRKTARYCFQTIYPDIYRFYRIIIFVRIIRIIRKRAILYHDFVFRGVPDKNRTQSGFVRPRVFFSLVLVASPAAASIRFLLYNIIIIIIAIV